MTRQARAVALLCSAFLILLGHSDAKADALTTQPASYSSDQLELTQTDFGGATGGGGSGGPSLVLGQFDTQGGSRVLDAIDLTFHGTLNSTYSLNYITPATESLTVGSGNPLTPGPQISLINPATNQAFSGTLVDPGNSDGGTQTSSIIHTPTDPAFWTRTVTYGTAAGQNLSASQPQHFGSDVSATMPDPNNPGNTVPNPFYLAPANSSQTLTIRLTNPSDLTQFMGSGTLALPVAANAFSSFVSTSGNGSGTVLTNASAGVSVSYEYSSQPAAQLIPEPAAFLVWGLGGLGSLLIWKARQRV